jgi:hypothetical protein
VNLYIAGAIIFVLAGGHVVVGHRFILRHLRSESLPETPLGGRAVTASLLTFTWDAVTVTLVAMGILVVGIAGHRSSGGRSLVAHTIGTSFALTFLRAVWPGRRRPSSLLRTAPIWSLFIVVSVLCWVDG